MLQGVQHVLANSTGWIILTAILQQTGAPGAVIEQAIRVGLIIVGVGVLLQSRRGGGFGSGHFCPPICGPVYASASVMAGHLYGLPVLFGMTVFAGIVEMGVATLVPRLRAVFPAEVVGSVMVMVGVSLIPFAMTRLIGAPDSTVGAPLVPASYSFVGLATLMAMVGVTVWARGRLRFYPTLIGLTVGGAAAAWTGNGIGSGWKEIMAQPWIDWPIHSLQALSFEPSLVLPFALAGLAGALKAVGDMALCQRADDPLHWQRVDLRNAGRGAMAQGMTTMLAGLLGAPGQNTASVNVGLAITIGFRERVLALVMGPMMIALAFLPKVASVIAHLPGPIMGGILTLAASSIMTAGLQILSSRLLDARRVVIVGLSLAFGISAAFMPQLYAGVPGLFRPAFVSGVALTTMVAVALNFLLRLGTTQRRVLTLSGAQQEPPAVEAAVADFAASVGARRDITGHATEAVCHCLDALGAQEVTLRLSFSEDQLRVDIEHDGPPIPLRTTPPDPKALLDEADGALQMTGFLVGRRADRVEATVRSGRSHLVLEFDH